MRIFTLLFPKTGAAIPALLFFAALLVTSPTGLSPCHANGADSAVASALAEDTSGMENRILTREKELQTFDPNSPVLWSGGSCGCLRELSGLTYGFYPFWIAGEEQLFDFGALSRIAYYSLAPDSSANFANRLHWEAGKTGFIKTAHKHKTKVDLVISCYDWKFQLTQASLDALKKAKVPENEIKKLNSLKKKEILGVENFISIVEKTLGKEKTALYKAALLACVQSDVYDPSFFTRFSPEKNIYIIDKLTGNIANLFRETKEPGFSGITLDFFGAGKNEQFNEKAVEIFSQLVYSLREKLDDINESHFLNIILPQSIILPDKDKNGFQENDLNELLPYINYIVVIMDTKEKNKKKELYKQLNQIQDSNRKKAIMRKILPMIPPTGFTEVLDDSLAFFEDNFGGVGIWPTPAMDKAEGAVYSSIRKEFRKDDACMDFIKRNLSVYFPEFCNFICPNRLIFRYIVGIMAGILVAFTILYMWLCPFRTFVKRYFWFALGFVLIFLLTGYSLVLCDPSFKNLSDNITVLFFILLFLYIIMRYIRKKRESDFP